MNLELLNKWVIYDEMSPSFLSWQEGVKRKTNFVGSLSSHGYWEFRLNNILYRNHRVIYFTHFQNGDLTLMVDHKDGNKQNNYIGNLRLVNNRHNSQNRKMKKNTSGVIGVGYSTKDNAYLAQWYDIDGKFKQRSFSINKFGNDLALHLASEHRNAMIAYLNNNCQDYTERHLNQ